MSDYQEWIALVQGDPKDKSTWYYRLIGPKADKEFHDDISVTETRALKDLQKQCDLLADKVELEITILKTAGLNGSAAALSQALDQFRAFKEKVR